MSETLLRYLNKQLGSEYDSMINYMNLASLQDDEEIKELLLEFSRQELDHAAMLMGFIRDQGGEPARADVEFKRFRSVMSALVLSAAEEESAIAMYEMIRQLLTDPREQAMIDKTIGQERSHYERLKNMQARLQAKRAEQSGEGGADEP